MHKKIKLIALLPLLWACKEQPSNTWPDGEVVIIEKDLIPEGTALDARTGMVYIGGTYKRKIIRISPEGVVEDFIPSEEDGLWSPVGMEVDEARDILWVNTAHANEVLPLMNPDETRDWMTGISAFSIQQKKLIKKYELGHPKASFNDLTVLPNGSVFATECVNNGIYRITPGADALELFLEPSGFSFLNGITYDESSQLLFVSSTQGILRVDPASKTYALLSTGNHINAKGIDGLAYYNDYLIGHQSSKVSKFYLNDDKTAIVKVELLDSGPEFDSSTTGEIGNGYYFFIVNSQIRSGVDYGSRSVKPLDSLENIIIRRIPL